MSKILLVMLLPQIIDAWSSLAPFFKYQEHYSFSRDVKKKGMDCFVRHRLNRPLQVSVFTSDSDVIFPSFMDDDDEDLESENIPLHESLKKRILSSERDILAPLARLAVAFSPPENSLRMKDLAYVDIIDVDEKHIELSAIVSDGQQRCVSLFVPVTFPHDCDAGLGESAEAECILENIDELDHIAEDKIHAMEVGDDKDTREVEFDKAGLSLSNNNINAEYPYWWVKPMGSSMVEECQNIAGILNDDSFTEALNDLAMQGMEYNSKDNVEEWNVEKAVLVDVGPAGFYLRARVVSSDNAKRKIAEIPCPFGIFGKDLVADSADELRAAVLGAVTVAQHNE